MKKQLTKTRFAVPVLTAMLMAACNGGGDLAGIGGSGFISTGTVTGFGSVYVNGVKFEIDQAQFEVEDRLDAGESDLRVGMVVQVQGSVNADGSTGSASFIRYADDLQGPVTAIDVSDPDFKRLTVLGKTVVISAADTSYDGLTYDSIITPGQLIEISGFYDQNGDLQASYVELQSDTFDGSSEVEVKGLISELSGTSFTVQGIRVDASSVSVFEGFANGLQNGLLVEVKGTFDVTANTLLATEVEAEGDLYADDDEVEIEGYVTHYTAIDNFEVNGVPVDASGVSTSLQLAEGDRIEVEGYIRNGWLIAEEIELRGGNVEISARLEQVLNNQQFTLRPVDNQPVITVQISDLTRMEDELGDDDRLSLADVDLVPGNFITVRGFEADNNNVTATRVKREAEIKDTELQGVVDSYVLSSATSGSVTVLGVTFTIDDNVTEFEENDVPLSLNDFLTALTVDETVISIEDKAENGGPDGVADSVEIED